jgi:hypothetical protein
MGMRSKVKRLLGLQKPQPTGPVKAEAIWSIGIYQGASPLALQPPAHVKNPALTGEDVTDVPALFVADPFMIRVDGNWHMFFEVFNKATRKGEIGCAVSNNGMNWKYKQIVLAEPFHLSYPCVFEWQGDHYMIPENRTVNEVRLYRAARFPDQWSHVATLLKEPYADSTVFRFENRWWMFTDASASFRLRHKDPKLGFRHDTLRLFYADQLDGTWHEHPKSPIVKWDPHIARPGGRVHVGESLIRFAQDCFPTYGTRLYAFRISQLSPTCYEESEIEGSPGLGPSGNGWNRKGMHHIDLHSLENGQWIACVDGFNVQQVPL